jgi:FkbM family methyltransferase
MTDTPYKAQFGEDRVLDDYFGHKREGFYVEIGAYNGVKMSNTYFFEQQGWTGILVEADPGLADECGAVRPRSTIVNCAVVAPDAPTEVTFQVSDEWKSLSSLSFNDARRKNIERLTGNFKVSSITVPGRTLDRILEDNGAGGIDFMTIDVEGHEWDVLRGFTIERWRPEILILERNTTFPDARILRYMIRHGYHYMRTSGVNDWFVRRGGDARLQNIVRTVGSLYVRQPMKMLEKRLRKIVWRVKAKLK